MKTLENGKVLVIIPGSHTGTYHVKTGMRLEFWAENHRSIDATCFLPTGSTTGELSPYGYIYAMDPMTLRDGHW